MVFIVLEKIFGPKIGPFRPKLGPKTGFRLISWVWLGRFFWFCTFWLLAMTSNYWWSYFRRTIIFGPQISTFRPKLGPKTGFRLISWVWLGRFFWFCTFWLLAMISNYWWSYFLRTIIFGPKISSFRPKLGPKTGFWSIYWVWLGRLFWFCTFWLLAMIPNYCWRYFRRTIIFGPKISSFRPKLGPKTGFRAISWFRHVRFFWYCTFWLLSMIPNYQCRFSRLAKNFWPKFGLI